MRCAEDKRLNVGFFVGGDYLNRGDVYVSLDKMPDYVLERKIGSWNDHLVSTVAVARLFGYKMEAPIVMFWDPRAAGGNKSLMNEKLGLLNLVDATC